MIKKNSAFTFMELSIVLLIIGILFTSVLLSTRLVREYRLGLARSNAKSSDITTIPGMILWLDATAENSITNTSDSTAINNGNLVKTWTDQNPQSNEKVVFSEKASGEGPTYIENGINGLPTLYFDYASTVGDGLVAPFSSDLNPGEYTLFMVTKPIEDTGDWEALAISRDTSLLSGFSFYINNANAYFHLWSGTGTTWEQTSESSAFSFGTPYILTGIRTGKDIVDNNIIFRNGTQTAISFSNSIFLPNSSSSPSTSRFFIGVGNTNTYFYDGYISEVIMYNRYLKPEERKLVESYLSKKYNIKLG